ncbi:MAG: hypothetical protein ABJA85_06065, partial [Bacteroidota bacterium]
MRKNFTPLFLFSFLFFVSFDNLIYAQERIGIPTTGAMGKKVSVAELQRLTVAADRLPKPIRM